MTRRAVWGPLVAVSLAVSLSGAASAWAACSVLVGDFDGSGRDDVRIVGDARPQGIYINDNQTSYQVVIDCDGDNVPGELGDVDTGVVIGEIETFDVQGKGQDEIGYVAAGTFSGALKNLVVTFGPGSALHPNALYVSMGALEGNSGLVVDVLGSASADVVEVSPQTLTGSSLTLRGDLGAGNDRVWLYAFDQPWTDSVVTADLSLGPGNNLLRVNPLSYLDNSTLAVRAEGSDAPANVDEVRWDQSGSLNSGSRILGRLRLLAGNDRLLASMITSPVSAGSAVHLRTEGGAGNDTLFLSDTPANLGTHANGGLVDLALAGGPGNDVLVMDWSGPVAGDGTTRLRLPGGDGRDLISGALDVDSSSTTPNLDLFLEGGRGDDSIFTTLLDDSGGATYNPLGIIVSSGGAGNDLCVFFGSGAGGGVTPSLLCESGF